MTRRCKWFIMTSVVFLGLIAVQSTMFVIPRREIRIDVDGQAGQSIVALVDVDGKHHKESRILPTDFSFESRNVEFTIIPEKNANETYLATTVCFADEHVLSYRYKSRVKGRAAVPRLLGLGSTNNKIGRLSSD